VHRGAKPSDPAIALDGNVIEELLIDDTGGPRSGALFLLTIAVLA
jgi:hypothetical protein